MGYYTNYKLSTEPRVKLNTDDLEKMSEGYSWYEELDGEYRIDDSVKWYDHDKHMTTFSRKKDNKKILFVLEGEGEESGDLWKAYYKNGKSVCYQAELIFPDFKEEDLK